MTIKDLELGESARILSVGGEGSLRHHFLDMGLIPGAVVTLVKYAPMGDPMELQLHGYELTLRVADAAVVEVIRLSDKEQKTHADEKAAHNKSQIDDALKLYSNQHPGLGEEGIYHDKASEMPLPEGETLSFALAGNQNSGKTTLFNQLTGSNQHVGNFPGVTVDRKSGSVRNYENTEITDLPGIYSLSPYTSEEIVSRQFILEENPKGIINIVDATNIERNLNLTLQLMELERPMVIALNMMDEMRGNGGSVNINAMEKILGIPVVPISAAKNEGIDELASHAVHVAKYQEITGRIDFCKADANGGSVHRCIHGIIHLIEDHAKAAGIPKRFAATKLIEGDKYIEEALKLTQNEKEMIEHIICQMEDERGLDRVAAIADMRFQFIEDLCAVTVTKPRESRERIRSEKIDKFLTGKYTAIPAFAAVMAIVFWLTFSVIGPVFQDLLEQGIDSFAAFAESSMKAAGTNEVIQSFLLDGVIAGVGSVLSFTPIIVILFFFLSMMEDSGYMARVAFVTDKLLRKIGLSGRSIVPMIVGFGCSVPGIMATRTLPSARDRKMTVLLIPFMSCPAKLPVYAFFAAALFPEQSGFVMVLLYILGILSAILVAGISKKTIFKGEAVPFVMELPNYRMPGPGNVLRLMWDKTKDFVQRAFTVILAASILIWFLQSFDFGLHLVEETDSSILASAGSLFAPLFKPLGFGDWRFVVALITGFIAKESVVSTLTVLFAGAELTSIMSPSAAAAILVFCLLYTPCVAAMAAVKRELGTKWAAGIIVFQCAFAWLMAFIVSLIV